MSQENSEPPDRPAAGLPPRAEEFFAGLLENTSLVVYLKDADGRYLYVNHRYEVLATVPREAILGKRDEDLFTPDVARLFRSQDAEVLKRGRRLEYTETIPLPGGMSSFITEKFPIIDKDGKVWAVGGFCTDITTQLSRANESLSAERERLVSTLRSLGEGLLSTGPDGRVLLLNPAAEQLLGRKQSDAVGLPVDEVLPFAEPGQPDPCGRAVRQAMASGAAVDLGRDRELTGADGTKRLVSACASPVRDRVGAVIGAVLTLRDVTQARRMAADLARTRCLESVGDLACGVAHDFNNLLTGVIWNLWLMKQEIADSVPLRFLLAEMEGTCKRAAGLAKQLLSFGRGGAQNRGPVALAPLLEDAARLVLSGSNIRFLPDFPAGLWPAHGDGDQLVQAFSGLLLNAREAMTAGGTVRLTARNTVLSASTLQLAAGRYVELTLSDDGPGLPAEVHARAFEPYASTKGRERGLGLFIAFSVIRRQGGHIRVEPAPARGACFSILLPAADQSIAEPAGAAAAPAAAARSGGRVLVMDDEELVRDVAEQMLREAGYAAQSVPDGAAAVAAFREAFLLGPRFDAVILDLTVRGGMGGWEAADQILAIDPAARIIISSGYSPAEQKVPRRKEGLASLRKPYTLDELSRAVAEVVAKH